MGSATAEVPISVTVVSRVEVKPEQLELRLLDVAVPTALEVRALDGEGHQVQGRTVGTTCLDEGVCRGDSRGQVWPVGAGATRVLVRVEEGEAAVAVRVTDERSAAGRPRRVKGNPMEHIGDAPAAAGPRARRR